MHDDYLKLSFVSKIKDIRKYITDIEFAKKSCLYDCNLTSFHSC